MRGTIDIAAEVAGGRAALRQRPIISNFQCSVSPLAYDANALEAAFVFGEAGIPTGFMYMTIGAGTAPATVAGNAVLAHAEVLAGMVLFELFFSGVPTFYGSCATAIELRSGSGTCGGPEDYLLQAMGCQMAHCPGRLVGDLARRLDGAITKAPLGREKSGANSTDRAKRGVKRSLLTEELR